ncbi:exosome complex protein Rrp42 [Candidatus Micrarchaeota archaeon]|nr:exosome complex protein Rrp42 [Candidatus Micrarchaeota archaeon]
MDIKDTIMSHVRRDVMNSSLEKGVRFDGRKFEEFRPIEIQRGPIRTAEGSAIAKVGNTTVLAACKFDAVTPFPDRPEEGVFMVNSELLPTASPTFETGPPDENSIELARVVDRAIRSAEIVDVKSFFIEKGKVLGLFVDLYVLNHAGNMTDAATMAATAALMDTKLPKIENSAIIRGEYTGMLNPKSIPVSTTFVKVGENWLVDPTRDEERVQETSVTISTTEEHVCTMQKRQGYLTKAELLDNIDIAFKRGNDIRRILKG